MRKLFLLFFTTLFFLSLNGQQQNWWMQSRILNVDPSDIEKFEKAVAKKTQMYNSEDGTARWITFRIITGSAANNYLRVQLANSPEEFDNIDTVGNAYWQKTVGPLHTSEGSRIWQRANGASFNPQNGETETLRRIIYYNYKDSGEQDFWRFRQRVKKSMEESGYGSRMSVFVCSSGCDGNWVQVRFHHDGFVGQAADYGEPLLAMIEKYNELYGDDAYEQDGNRVDDALMPDGRRIRHHQLIPELSSPPRG